jgi:DNA-binding SARP family transcriptional activator
MVTIRLLGQPVLERDGAVAPPPRGRKSWALLAYLMLAERPPGRRRLAELLFGDADDPLGALRWTLAELRRAIGEPGLFAGDPVATALPAGVTADVHLLADDAADPAPLLAAEGELLDGVHLPACLEFESWLLVARHRASAAVEARLRETAVTRLAAGRADQAVPFAARAVARNPLDEGTHELLVRALAMAGDRPAALRQVAVCEELLRRELGVDPSPALREAAGAGATSGMLPPSNGRAAAESQLEAGRAAIAAGAVDAGIQCLRRAVTEAAGCGDDALRARSLVALGGALVHAVRGRDEEGTVVLHEAAAAAKRAGERATAVTAYRELGFVEVQAGRRATGDAWLTRARELAETDAELAGILGVRGQNASDRGDYARAFEDLGESVELADRCADRRQQAWSLSLVGRAHLLRGEHAEAHATIGRSLELVQEQRWLAFLPWPQTLQADLDLGAGDVEGAADGLERAWALAEQLGDPCWQGMAARGLGLLHAGRGDGATAASWLTEATARAKRQPDRYQWVHAHVLDAAAGNAAANGDTERARSLAGALGALAARCDLRELLVRAWVHRARLGEPEALATARLLGDGVDNPALAALYASPSL